jgi:hypothetical protein
MAPPGKAAAASPSSACWRIAAASCKATHNQHADGKASLGTCFRAQVAYAARPFYIGQRSAVHTRETDAQQGSGSASRLIG